MTSSVRITTASWNNNSHNSPSNGTFNGAVTQYNPTFLLRSTDGKKVLADYLAGKYTKNEYPAEKLTSSGPTITFTKVLGASPEEEIYTYTDRSNHQQKVLTSNHRKYAVIRDGKYDEKKSYICHWCRQPFTNPMIGIPILMEYDLSTSKCIFYVDGNYCRFECCFANLKEKIKGRMIYRNSLYNNSESMLRTMHHMMYPELTLKAAQDWTLLKNNGGPLEKDEYYNTNEKYKQVPNLIFLPLKIEYMT